MSENATNHEKVSDAAASGSGLRYSTSNGIDLSLLEDSLSKTPWERMLANDDALNFAESLQAAMLQRHAKSK